MSFILPKNLSDFISGTNNDVVGFDTLSGFLNPVYNRLVFDSVHCDTIRARPDSFLKVLGAIFSRNNLLENDLELVNHATNGQFQERPFRREIWRLVIERLEDKYLPIIPYCTIPANPKDYHVLNPANWNREDFNQTNVTIKIDTLENASYVYVGPEYTECGLTIISKPCNNITMIIEQIKLCYDKLFGNILHTAPNGRLVFQSVSPRQSSFTNTLLTYIYNKGLFKGTIDAGNRNFDFIYNILRSNGFIISDETIQLNYNLRIGRYQITYTESFNENNRASLYREFGYQTAVPSILPGKMKTTKEGTPIYIGIELEVSTSYSYQQLIDAQKNIFFICKHDSSISGSKPVKTELVTRVGSIKWLKQQWAEFFNNVDYKNFDTSTLTNNGMHVHVDRTCFDDDIHVRNFTWMINNPANTPFIVALSERGSLDAMRTFCAIVDLNGMSKTTSLRNVVQYAASNRGAVNFKDGLTGKTIEVRIFKGIVSFASILKNLEFVESLFEFSRNMVSYRKLNLEGYFEFVFKTPNNKYIALKRFLEDLNFQDFITTAQMRELIDDVKRPEDVVKILNKSGITLTSEHLAILNKGKKRVYYLDNGELKIVDYSGKLANLDKSFAKRYFFKKN